LFIIISGRSNVARSPSPVRRRRQSPPEYLRRGRTYEINDENKNKNENCENKNNERKRSRSPLDEQREEYLNKRRKLNKNDVNLDRKRSPPRRRFDENFRQILSPIDDEAKRKESGGENQVCFIYYFL
jgi:hypothetical protein